MLSFPFLVRYAVGQDLQLARHRDNSKVTLNVNLGKEFEGATLFYQGVQPSAFAKVQFPARVCAVCRACAVCVVWLCRLQQKKGRQSSAQTSVSHMTRCAA